MQLVYASTHVSNSAPEQGRTHNCVTYGLRSGPGETFGALNTRFNVSNEPLFPQTNLSMLSLSASKSLSSAKSEWMGTPVCAPRMFAVVSSGNVHLYVEDTVKLSFVMVGL